MIYNKKLIIVVAAILIAGFLLSHKSNGNQPVFKAKRGEIIEAVYATGVVEPVTWVRITPEIAGTVVAIPVKEGDKVKVGDVLLQMDDSEQQAMRGSGAAQAEFLDKEIKRQSALLQKKFASEQSLQRTTSERDGAMAEIQRAEALIAKKRITSPIDGTILKRDVEIGESLQPIMPFQDTKEIFWVGQMKPLRVTAEVDEEDISLVSPGKKVLITSDAFPDKITEGVLESVTLKGDPVNKNFRVRISLPDDTPLMIGMTVEVNIIAKESANALIVPKSSVKNGKLWLKKTFGDEQQEVVTGIESEDMVEILSGIEEGDEIFINPPAK